MVKIVACMLTHIPATACRSIPLISRIDHLVIHLPESQVGDMKDRLKSVRHRIKKIEVIGHRIELAGDVPQMGLLRDGQQELLQSRMKKNEIGILMDHDIMNAAAVVISPSILRAYNRIEKERNESWQEWKVAHISNTGGYRRAALTGGSPTYFLTICP